MGRILFPALAGAACIALAAALTAEPLEPAFALRSETVYREEVGLAVFAGVYLVVMALCLAARGRLITRIDLPGGAGFEATAVRADDRAELAASVEAVTDWLAALESRLERLEEA